MSLLSKLELKTLTEKREEWCVSIFMPTQRVGPEIQQDPIRFKNLLVEAEERLLTSGFRNPEAKGLLEPTQRFLQDRLFWQHQSDGLAMFLSPEVYRHYRLPLDFEDLVIVTDRFHIKPLLPLLTGDGRFYVLALSQNEIRLLQGTRYSVGQVDLENVPGSLAEALRWDDPEKRLQWHTGTGAKSDGRAAIFHGHGVASADDPKDYILRYFRQIDKGLSEVLAGERAPLVLAGVDYLHPIYEEANSYPHLMDKGITGNPEELRAEELHEQAWAIVQPRFQKEQRGAATRYRQLAGTGSELASNEIEQIVPAAFHGRVETLFVALGLQRWGTFDPATNDVHLHQQAEPGDEDLLDLAAVQTFLNNGTVYAVEPEGVPAEAALAAVFRY